MNGRAIRRLRERLAEGGQAYGLWVTLEAPSIAELAVGLGLDWVVIDAEHGHLDWSAIVAHLRAAVRSDTVALVRLTELNGGAIKRALDLGADGVVIPWVEEVEQLRQAVEFAQYPPQGRRGIGAERAAAWGQALVEHTRTANEQVLVIPILETVRGVQQAATLARVPGVDCFFFGPADLSASAGYRGQWEGPGVAEQIVNAQAVLRAAGKHCGLLARDAADLQRRRDQGFQLIGLGTDAGLLIRAVRSSLSEVGRDATIHADLTPNPLPSRAPPAPLTAAAPASCSAGLGLAQDALGPSSALPVFSPLDPERLPGPDKFHLGLTADFFSPRGEPRYRDMGPQLARDYPQLVLVRLNRHEPELQPEQLCGLQGLVVLTPRVSQRSLEQARELLVLARFGVGYDTVDVAACTSRDIAVTITAGAVDRPVAEATLTWMLALSHHVRMKDRLVREGRWDERSQYMGTELRERTLGVIGCGGIGRQLLELLRGLGMRTPLAYDPLVSPEQISACGARAVSLDELLASADFVSLHCPLNDATRGLIGAPQLARMKPTAFLINTARGGLVDEDALHAALAAGRLAGAALDCFAAEPVAAPSRFADCDNVLLAPHAIAWTDELFRDIGRLALGGVRELLAGRRPHGLLNPEVLERPGFQAKWRRWRAKFPD